ncbi:glycosyltransferase family 4 protein [Novosphingobium sp. RD2P27]|uniref:Glycosyltransferase family 4 protein n=1 Tax=Novosphingobium kalidii TaxID=3230299 RepID=A0ABV2D515_9SPHN
MRIAQVAPLAEAVPPKLYGGTERVVWWLTEALVDLGHDVALFASGDSVSSAKLIPCAPAGLRLCGVGDHTASTLAMLDQVFRSADQFDIIHFHVDLLQYPLFRGLAGKCVTTLHGRQDLPDNLPVFGAFPEMKLVSISDNQRTPIPHANFISTVYHGMPLQLIPVAEGGDYLAFIGRISPEKRPDRAIEIAKRAGMKLKIAAKVDRVDAAYFHEVIEPLIDGTQIEFINEVGDAEKAAFLGGARALLFPIDWPEPFGLVMIEAMAAGTPVIAWRNGSTPEVVEHGRSGYLVESIEEAVAAVHAAADLPRSGVRAAFDERFTSARMAEDYLHLYRSLTSSHPQPTMPLVLAAA